MQPFLDNPALKQYALACTIVGVHMLLLALWTGTVRVRNKTWVNPEDATLNKGTQADADHPAVQRVKRAHQNAIENAVPFVPIALLYALSNPSVGTAQAYFFTFAGARVLHSIFYLWGRQPFRTLMFVIGVLSTFGMAFHVLRAVI